MTTKDTTRFLHQPRKHYAAGYLQQGRPLLDSDVNESLRLVADDRRRAFVDVTGGMGSPDNGFSLAHPIDLDFQGTFIPIPLTFPVNIQRAATTFDGTSIDIFPFSIRPGTAFLGGMRFELEQHEPFAFQRDFLQMQADDVRDGEFDFGQLYYLHAWEQGVTAVEDRELLEQSLGGPDTTVRVRRMRRVELNTDFPRPQIDCDEAFFELVQNLERDNGEFDWTSGELRSLGRLHLEFQGGSDGNPCTPDPPAQYLGTENQTLRIMLTDAEHFVWAIDNGAPLYRVKVTGLDDDRENVRVTMLTPPRDGEHEPRSNQVIELLPFGAILDDDAPPNASDPHFNKVATDIGFFTRVRDSFEASSNSFLVDSQVTSSDGDVISLIRDTVHRWESRHPAKKHLSDEGGVRYFYMRVWHDAPTALDVELPTSNADTGAPGGPLLGKTGIQPFFPHAGRRGDFWTATLRVDQRGRIVPYELLSAPDGVPPHGPRHFYMPLCLFRIPSADRPDLGEADDCRPRLRPLRDMGCETRTVGDGVKSIGDFKTIAEAIESLPLDGGRIVVRPGVYREEILVPSNVVLEGCGEDTVLESPAAPEESAVVRVASGASNVKLRNFLIHAVEQSAVEVTSGDRVELAALDVVAFTAGGVPGSGASDEPLVRVSESTNSELRALRVEPARRPALFLVGGSDTRIEGLSATSESETADAPDEPLVFFQNSRRIKVRDTSLEAFGQKAILMQGAQEVSFTKLEVFSGAHTDDVTTLTSLDVDGCTDVLVEDSRFVQEASPTEHATIVLMGTGLTLRANSIESPPLCLDDPAPEDPDLCDFPLAVAWGGIQVRGNSSNVQIVRNHVRGGLGHGITLGSVIWGENEVEASLREGAGKVQTTIQPSGEPPQAFVDGNLAPGFPVGGDQFVPFVEGSIGDVLIAENRIEQMATNGISVLTVLGLAESENFTDLFLVERLRIERNVIADNLRQLPDDTIVRSDMTPLSTAAPNIPQDLQVLPYAGITLGTVTSATISGNQIVGNGSSQTMPVCGIFVLNGDGVVISRNRVLDNGGLASPTDPLSSGVRAGIVVLLSGTDAARNSDDLSNTLDVNEDSKVEARSLNAGELAGDFALRILDNVVRQPEGRALHVISTGMVSIDGNFLSSRGYHGSATPVDEQAIGDVVFVQGLGGPWESYNALDFPSTTILPTGGNDSDALHFATLFAPKDSHGWLTNVVPSSPRLYVGAGGGVLFHNNQVVYDWEVKIVPGESDVLSTFPVVILGQDHVGAIGNQFALRLQGVDNNDVGSAFPGGLFPEPILAHALIGGYTTQVARNRFAEPIESARVSLITGGDIFNITTLNHGTHPTLAYRWGHPVSNQPPGIAFTPPDEPRSFHAERNPALFTRAGVDFLIDIHNNFSFAAFIRAFFQLLNQRSGSP